MNRCFSNSSEADLPDPKTLLEHIGWRQLLPMFDLLPDLLFWIKDRNGRFLFANVHLLKHLAKESVDELIGLTDYDLSPKNIADQFVQDDQRLQRGEVIDDRLEMNFSQSGELCWFSTSKRPILDAEGRFIGSYGFSRHLDRTSFTLAAIDDLRLPVEYIRRHYAENLRVDEIAANSNLSVSALEKRFRKHLRTTPKQFINELRLENARRLLRTSALSIASIAHQTGFPDPGYFTRQFTKRYGELPSEFRARLGEQ